MGGLGRRLPCSEEEELKLEEVEEELERTELEETDMGTVTMLKDWLASGRLRQVSALISARKFADCRGPRVA